MTLNETDAFWLNKKHLTFVRNAIYLLRYHSESAISLYMEMLCSVSCRTKNVSLQTPAPAQHHNLSLHNWTAGSGFRSLHDLHQSQNCSSTRATCRRPPWVRILNVHHKDKGSREGFLCTIRCLVASLASNSVPSIYDHCRCLLTLLNAPSGVNSPLVEKHRFSLRTCWLYFWLLFCILGY